MNKLFFGFMLGVASLVGQNAIARADQIQACQSATQIKSLAEIGTSRHGGRVLSLDGGDATRFVTYLNSHIGDPSVYKGDTLIIGVYADLGYVLVGFVNSGCVDQKNLVKLDPKSFIKAYSAARGMPA